MNEADHPNRQPDDAGEDLYELEDVADSSNDEGPATLYPELSESDAAPPAPASDEPWAEVEQPKAVDPVTAARKRDEARKAAAEQMAHQAAVKRRAVLVVVGVAAVAAAVYFLFIR